MGFKSIDLFHVCACMHVFAYSALTAQFTTCTIWCCHDGMVCMLYKQSIAVGSITTNLWLLRPKKNHEMIWMTVSSFFFLAWKLLPQYILHSIPSPPVLLLKWMFHLRWYLRSPNHFKTVSLQGTVHQVDKCVFIHCKLIANFSFSLKAQNMLLKCPFVKCEYAIDKNLRMEEIVRSNFINGQNILDCLDIDVVG